MKSKSEWRRLASERRRSMPDNERYEASALIAQRLFSLEAWRQASMIYMYCGYGDEVQTGEILECALAEGKRTALPRVLNEKDMVFSEIRSADELDTGRFGIPEPSGEALERVTDISPDIIIVPCVGVAMDGNRIGHGRGYYDRVLCAHKDIPKICLAFEAQIVGAFTPQDTDIRMDMVITEKRCVVV